MSRGIFGTPIAPAFNAVAAKLIDVPLLGNVVRRNLVVISYVGRRSGKTFTTPVNYRRVGDEVVIRVGLPGAKTWWRNFLGERRPDYAAAQRHRPNRARRRDPRRSRPGDRHGQAPDLLFSRNRLNVAISLVVPCDRVCDLDFFPRCASFSYEYTLCGRCGSDGGGAQAAAPS
jgi:hypothetical protein